MKKSFFRVFDVDMVNVMSGKHVRVTIEAFGTTSFQTSGDANKNKTRRTESR